MVVAYQMVGIENILISAQAQFEAGADAVMWADHTTGDLCRAETYRDFLLEMHQQITQGLWPNV